MLFDPIYLYFTLYSNHKNTYFSYYCKTSHSNDHGSQHWYQCHQHTGFHGSSWRQKPIQESIFSSHCTWHVQLVICHCPPSNWMCFRYDFKLLRPFYLNCSIVIEHQKSTLVQGRSLVRNYFKEVNVQVARSCTKTATDKSIS